MLDPVLFRAWKAVKASLSEVFIFWSELPEAGTKLGFVSFPIYEKRPFKCNSKIKSVAFSRGSLLAKESRRN